MCFFSSPKAPEPPAAPAVTPVAAPAAEQKIASEAVAPLPSPTATEVSPQLSAQQKRKKIESARQGVLSTIKTSPQGVTGSGADLMSGTGKKTLGS
jgi:hypothetical protein